MPAAQLAIRHPRGTVGPGHHVEGPAVEVVAARHRPVQPPAADGVDVEDFDHQPVQALGGQGEDGVAGRVGPAEVPPVAVAGEDGQARVRRPLAGRASQPGLAGPLGVRRRAASSALILRISRPDLARSEPWRAWSESIFSSRACWAAAQAADRLQLGGALAVALPPRRPAARPRWRGGGPRRPPPWRRPAPGARCWPPWPRCRASWSGRAGPRRSRRRRPGEHGRGAAVDVGRVRPAVDHRLLGLDLQLGQAASGRPASAGRRRPGSGARPRPGRPGPRPRRGRPVRGRRVSEASALASSRTLRTRSRLRWTWETRPGPEGRRRPRATSRGAPRAATSTRTSDRHGAAAERARDSKAASVGKDGRHVERRGTLPQVRAQVGR